MPVNRQIFEKVIYANTSHLGYLCPTCEQGHYRLKNEVITEESRQSKEGCDLGLEPENYFEAKFATFVECDNPECGETALFAGTQHVEVEPYCGCPDCQRRGCHYLTIFKPSQLSPSPQLIKVPSGTPEDIVLLVRKAFSEVWGDPASALNSIRMTMEELTGMYGVSPLKAKGGYKPLELRLRELEPLLDTGTIARAEAVRWLGNAGSHVGAVSRDDAFDGFDVLELVLAYLIDSERTQIDRRVAQINKAKGIPS